MTTATHTDLKLYRVRSTIDGWPHRRGLYNGVRVDWFVHSRSYDPGFDYSAVLDRPLPAGEGYSYEQGLVDDLFTKAEADQFAAYLKTSHGDDVTIEAVTIPIDGGCMPTSAIAVGGPEDFHMLSEHDDYPLPFKVWGHYSVEDQDPVKVLACSHKCKHHARVDEYIDYVPVTQPSPTPSSGQAPPF
jgi:hypothetical protein